MKISFSGIEDIKSKVSNDDFDAKTSQITIGDVLYKKSSQQKSIDIDALLSSSNIFSLAFNAQDADIQMLKDKGLSPVLLVRYASNGSQIKLKDVVMTTAARQGTGVFNNINEESTSSPDKALEVTDNDSTPTEEEPQTEVNLDVKEGDKGKEVRVGQFMCIQFVQFTGEPQLVAKVDTGADYSSLHATNTKIDADKGNVSFKCPELSPHVITLPLHSMHSVRSANGDQERPVIQLPVVINTEKKVVKLQNVRFNLQDRSSMNTSMLVGRNILTAANFIIDVKESEESEESEEPTLPNSLPF